MSQAATSFRQAWRSAAGSIEAAWRDPLPLLRNDILSHRIGTVDADCRSASSRDAQPQAPLHLAPGLLWPLPAQMQGGGGLRLWGPLQASVDAGQRV